MCVDGVYVCPEWLFSSFVIFTVFGVYKLGLKVQVYYVRGFI
jgi:hypothetical protein